MLQELQDAVGEEDPSLRCITLQAQGKVFSAGHNLKELVSGIFVLIYLLYWHYIKTIWNMSNIAEEI